jgi:protein disulfide-isomerase A1
MGKFAEGLLDGSISPEYKSAPIPDEPTEGGVSVVVGKNFEEIVKDEGKVGGAQYFQQQQWLSAS